jgi:hypothetical protein
MGCMGRVQFLGAIANQVAAMQCTQIHRSDPERRDDGGATPQP